MAEGDAYTSKKWGLWVQPDGPNTGKHFLGCHDVDDIAAPKGSTTLIRCFRSDGSGEWDIIGSTHNPPDPVTTTITTPIMETADWLEHLVCPATLFVLGRKCGRHDVFLGWQRGFALNLAEKGDEKLTGLARREEDVASEQSFAFEARPPLLRFYEMHVAQQPTTETEALNDVVFCNTQKCADECGNAGQLCEDGIAVGDALAASPTNTADVIETADSGESWAAAAADPFAGGEDIMSAVCFPITGTTIRWLVAREADLAAAMEVAYSDDGGATWTLVTVGATVGQGANYGGALFALNAQHIWLVTDGGYVYFSSDGGESWTAQDEAEATANDLNAIWGDENTLMAVGDSDTVIVTHDGGETWNVIAAGTGGGNDLLTVGLNPYGNGIWFVGDNAGELYYSNDDGVMWTQRTGWVGSGTGEIRDIQFANELCGFMVHNDTGPVGRILRTIDGGDEWERLTNPATNAGLNALWVCDCNLVFAVGEPSAGTAVIYKAHGLLPTT